MSHMPRLILIGLLLTSEAFAASVAKQEPSTYLPSDPLPPFSDEQIRGTCQQAKTDPDLRDEADFFIPYCTCMADVLISRLHRNPALRFRRWDQLAGLFHEGDEDDVACKEKVRKSGVTEPAAKTPAKPDEPKQPEKKQPTEDLYDERDQLPI